MSPLELAVVMRKLIHLKELLEGLQHLSVEAAIDLRRVHAAMPVALQDLSELQKALTARVRI
jgi:hypothetical protein